ncbi:MAG: M56 family metallopeptidase [Christensenellales bacterium]|jgi:hypothetical protein
MTQWAISSSVLLAAILLLRSLFRKKISPKLQYGIWALALLRLLLPFSLFILPGSVLNAPIPGQTAAPVMQTQIAETIVGDESPVPEPAKTPRPPPRLRWVKQKKTQTSQTLSPRTWNPCSTRCGFGVLRRRDAGF